MVTGTGFAPYAVPGGSVAVDVDATSTLATGGALDWHGRAYVVRRPDGVVLMVYRSATSHLSNDAELRIRFTDDDGATWTAVNTTLGGDAVSGFPLNPPLGNINVGEGLPFYAPNGDLILHAWSYTGTWGVDAVPKGIYQYRSLDGGESWTLDGACSWAGTTDDLRVFSTDQAFVLDGVVWAGARHYTVDNGSEGELWLVKNTTSNCAHGSWEKVSDILTTSDITDGGQEVGIVYLGGETLLALIRDNAHTHGYQRRSTDMGATWGALEDITATVGRWGRNKVYTRAQLKGGASWWTDPVLINITFTHQASGDSMPRRNCVNVSRDAGATWSTPFYVDSETDDAGYGDVFYDTDSDQWVVVNYGGTLLAASLKQYRLSIAGV